MVLLLFSCKEKSKQSVTIGEISDTKEKQEPPLQSIYHYVAENGVTLYSDVNIDYTSKKIRSLDFLEPVEIIEVYKNQTHTVSYGGLRELRGYVCKIKTQNDQEGFIFSELIKTYEELSKRVDMTGLDQKSIDQHGRISKAEGMRRLFNSLDNKPAKEYHYTIANRLSLRKKPSLDAERITVLKYLEPVEVLENFPNKKETIEDKQDGIIQGNWCKIRMLDSTEGYAFNGYIQSFSKLSKELGPKGIEANELRINGTLKTKTTLERFLEVIGTPDSIRSYKVVKDDFSGTTHREYQNGILYIVQNTPFEELDYGEGGWIYDDVAMTYYYKNGIEYEELNGEVSFSNIDFTQNNNYLTYNGSKIDSTTSLKTISNLFPVQSMHIWRRYDDTDGEVFEFGTTREKSNNGFETYWQLYCEKKARGFNVYWYD